MYFVVAAPRIVVRVKGLVSRTFNCAPTATGSVAVHSVPTHPPPTLSSSLPSPSNYHFNTTANVTFNDSFPSHCPMAPPPLFSSPSSPPTSPSQLMPPPHDTPHQLITTQYQYQYQHAYQTSSNIQGDLHNMDPSLYNSHTPTAGIPLVKPKVGFRSTVTGACKSLPMKISTCEINNNQHYSMTSQDSGKSSQQHNRPRSVSFSRVLSTKHAPLSTSESSTFAVTESTFRFSKSSPAAGYVSTMGGSNNLLSPNSPHHSQSTLVCSSSPSPQTLAHLPFPSPVLTNDADTQSLPYLTSRVEPGLFNNTPYWPSPKQVSLD